MRQGSCGPRRLAVQTRAVQTPREWNCMKPIRACSVRRMDWVAWVKCRTESVSNRVRTNRFPIAPIEERSSTIARRGSPWQPFSLDASSASRACGAFEGGTSWLTLRRTCRFFQEAVTSFQKRSWGGTFEIRCLQGLGLQGLGLQDLGFGTSRASERGDLSTRFDVALGGVTSRRVRGT
jgi:hypothetical protein